MLKKCDATKKVRFIELLTCVIFGDFKLIHLEQLNCSTDLIYVQRI